MQTQAVGVRRRGSNPSSRSGRARGDGARAHRLAANRERLGRRERKLRANNENTNVDASVRVGVARTASAPAPARIATDSRRNPENPKSQIIHPSRAHLTPCIRDTRAIRAAHKIIRDSLTTSAPTHRGHRERVRHDSTETTRNDALSSPRVAARLAQRSRCHTHPTPLIAQNTIQHTTYTHIAYILVLKLFIAECPSDR